jgi:putative ABC transport system substrate-binding protein
VNVIVTSGTGPTLSVMQSTKDIPIVFAAAGDPVGTGIVASLARPGGNVTGLSNQQTDLAGNRLELLREVIPGLKRVAVMGNVNVPNVTLEMNEVQNVAPRLGIEVRRLEVHKTEDIVPGIEALAGKVQALYVCTDPLITHTVRINTLALTEKLPTMYAFREYVRQGGMMSYGPNFPDLFRRAGDFVDKILKGAKPADIPVEQPVKFDLIVNLTTAKALGLAIPEVFLVRANEVIE